MTPRASLAMTTQEIADFVATQGVGVVCGHDAAGVLTARRCELHQVANQVQLTLAPPACPFDLSNHQDVCVAIDTYPSHEGIKGVIMSGQSAWSDESAVMTVEVERVISFDFSSADTSLRGGYRKTGGT